MKKLSLENIYEWPLATKLLVYLLISAITVYGGYRLTLAAQINNLSAAEKKERELKEQISFVVKKSQKIENQVSRLSELQTMLSEWDKQLISYNALPELLNDILKVGNNNNLTFNLFTPGTPGKIIVGVKEKEKEGAATGGAQPADSQANAEAKADEIAAYQMTMYKISIKAVVIGSYHDIANFVSQIANLPWIVSVGDFSVTPASSEIIKNNKSAKLSAINPGDLLIAELDLGVYYLPERQLNEQS